MSNLPLMATPLARYVIHFKQVLPAEFCQSVVAEYKDHKALHDAQLVRNGEAEMDTDHRRAKHMLITDPDIYSGSEAKEKINETLLGAFNGIANAYNNILKDGGAISDDIHINENEGFILLKYVVGGFHKQHVDEGTGLGRQLTAVINMSDDYEGGKFGFFNDEIQIDLAAGDALVFPASFMFPHSVSEITRGERFSVITWLR